ncbi:MAG TPA: Hsp70 family protein, partial [Rugosimonospora sp.]|nr:Hsp70 family protein [Rugosimonospora sp.]
QAGMPPVRIVEEPVAAATYFASVLGRQVPIGSVVVVHDFGAGTFDASVVARHAVGFEVLAVDGRGDLGGLDIDAQIVGHFAQQYRGLDEAAWQRLTEPTTLEDRRHRRLLWEDACAVKEQLSRSNAADLVIPLVNVDAHLTRSELEALAEPLLQRTVEVTQGAIRWAKLAEGRVAGLFLVGGSSRIPLLATLLHRSLGYPPEVLEQPELVVAEGALFAAAVPPTSPSATVMWKLPPPAVPLLPTSGAPVSGGAPGPSPVSVPPAPGMVSGVPGVVSGAPAAPASPAPAPGSPAPTPVGFQSGRAVVPDARPARTPRPPAVVNPTRALPPVTSPPTPGYGPYAPPVHVSAPPAPEPVWTGGAAHPQPSGRAGRIIGRLVTVLVLLATPLVAAYIAYQITTDQPLWPILITY